MPGAGAQSEPRVPSTSTLARWERPQETFSQWVLGEWGGTGHPKTPQALQGWLRTPTPHLRPRFGTGSPQGSSWGWAPGSPHRSLVAGDHLPLWWGPEANPTAPPMSLLCQQQGSPPSSYPVPSRGRHADVVVKIKLYSFGNKNIESAHQCTSSHLKTAEHIGLKSRGGKGRSQPPRKVREGTRAALCSPPRFAAPGGVAAPQPARQTPHGHCISRKEKKRHRHSHLCQGRCLQGGRAGGTARGTAKRWPSPCPARPRLPPLPTPAGV